MTAAVALPRALRIKPAALEQQVTRWLQRHRGREGTLPAPVLLVRAEPVWEGRPVFEAGDRTIRVVACVSPLAVLEQVTGHVRGEDGSVLVVLTDRDEGELGNGVLSHALRHQVLTVEPWSLVEETFGAQRLDPRLAAERWAAEALIDAMPPGGWPPLSGTVLNRDVALRHLAARRLGLDRLGLAPDDLDAQALLLWSALGAAAPAGWRPLDDQHPAWWSLARVTPEAQPVPAAVPQPRKPRGRAPVPEGQAALDLVAATAPSPEPPGGATLVDALLDSEMFAAQHGLTPRKVPASKIRAAITALLEANGVLPVTVLADRAGEHAARAGGFVTTLQRIFNVDNYPVLSVVDDGRTVRLDARLLREQFGLREGRG